MAGMKGGASGKGPRQLLGDRLPPLGGRVRRAWMGFRVGALRLKSCMSPFKIGLQAICRLGPSLSLAHAGRLMQLS